MGPSALRPAFAALVDFQAESPLGRAWGPGTLSSSDGQRFLVAGHIREARAQPPYFGRRRGVTIYTWTGDRYAQYGAKVIPSTERDATYVLDEILDNETGLEILEHTVDTHGYTDLRSLSSTGSRWVGSPASAVIWSAPTSGRLSRRDH